MLESREQLQHEGPRDQARKASQALASSKVVTAGRGQPCCTLWVCVIGQVIGNLVDQVACTSLDADPCELGLGKGTSEPRE